MTMDDVPEEENKNSSGAPEEATEQAAVAVVVVAQEEEEDSAGAAAAVAVASPSSSVPPPSAADGNVDEEEQPLLLQQLPLEKEEVVNEKDGSSAADPDENKMDEDGLRHDGYDVVLYGTGLVQSILASALSRAGKKVLHIDAADYYGELDAVWTLPYLLLQQQELHHCEQQQQQQQQQQQDGGGGGGTAVQEQDDNVDDDDDDALILQNEEDDTSSTRTQILSLSSRGGLQGFQIHSMARQEDSDFFDDVVCSNECDNDLVVMTPYGKGRIINRSMKMMTTTRNKSNSLAISLTDWKLASSGSSSSSSSSSHPTLYVGIPSDLVDDDALKESKTNTTTMALLHRYLVQTAKIIPYQAVLAREILDQRSRSIALDISPGLLYAHGPAVQGLLTSHVADYCEFKSLQGLWWWYYRHDDEKTARSKSAKNADSKWCHVVKMTCLVRRCSRPWKSAG
jgi:GDP dissociation inhibitor